MRRLNYLVTVANNKKLHIFQYRLIKIKEWIDKNDPGATIIPFSGVLEQKLSEMETEERKKYLEEHNTTRWVIKSTIFLNKIPKIKCIIKGGMYDPKFPL